MVRVCRPPDGHRPGLRQKEMSPDTSPLPVKRSHLPLERQTIWHRTSALVVCPLVTVTTPAAWHGYVPLPKSGLWPTTVYRPGGTMTEKVPLAPT